MLERWQVKAQRDPRLQLTVLSQRTLRYTVADTDGDRPAHVRAASGLTRVANRWYIVQDDTAFIAVADASTVAALPVGLPGTGDRKQFSAALGNKAAKPDFEACFSALDDATGEPRIWVFGSGSTVRRRSIAVVDPRIANVTVYDATALHQQIVDDLGHLPNLEGACVCADWLWLFHRGNTGPGDRGCCAYAWPWQQVQAWLQRAAPAPTCVAVCDFRLGAVAGVPLGITDAALGSDGRVVVLCAAEGSANAVDDGVVLGACMGVLDTDGNGRWSAVRMADLPSDLMDSSTAASGQTKPEGLFFDVAIPGRAYLVADPDDTEQPAQLSELALVGPWWGEPADLGHDRGSDR